MGSSNIPPAAFILMALESARQLQPTVNPSALFTLLSDIVFDRLLPLALFKDLDTVLELHFLTYRLNTTDGFRFEIVSLATEGQGSSIRHCSGKLLLTNLPVEHSGMKPLTIQHDSFLLERWDSSKQSTLRKLEKLKVSSEGQSGTFESNLSHESYTVDPLVLDSILNLAPVSVLNRSLPTRYLLSSIKTVLVPLATSTNTYGNFITSVKPTQLNGVESTIRIALGNSFITFSDISYDVACLDWGSPTLKSLFFTPVIKTDISTMSPSKPITLFKCLELATHKWPMSDIGVIGVANKDISNILTCLPGASSQERPLFRSIHITGELNKASSQRVRFVKDLDPSIMFHLVLVGSYSVAKEIYAQLLPNGLMCIQTCEKSQEEDFCERSRFICTVTDHSDGEQWLLWQKERDLEQQLTPHKAKIFACPKQPISSVDCLPCAEHILLDPRTVGEFCAHIQSNRFDAVILDCQEKSVIATWPGEDILPWLQALLRLADSILWVTTRIGNSPHSNIAGSLLRTLQAEMPSLKVTWLILDETETESAQQARIASACSGLLNGENEVRLEVRRSQVDLLRYYPDDGLSTTTGLDLPRVVAGSILEKNYEISPCTPGKPVILSSHRDVYQELEAGKICVGVEASVIDAADVLAVNGNKSKNAERGFGRFFSGRVTSQTEKSFPAGSKVVGWHADAHRNQLIVPPENLLLYDGATADDAAAAFAAIATALCIVDGITRGREGDTFKIELNGILGEAITRFCEWSKATVLGVSTTLADFTITLNSPDGLLINGSPIEINTYLESERGLRTITEAWECRNGFTSPVNTFNLADYRLAFNVAISEAYSTVLSHSEVAKVTSSVAAYKRASKLLSSDGAYVVIGGLGGLGRFVCSWMVANGAKNLVSISRNGLSSREAQKTFSTINASGASLEVIKADACDRVAISHALDQVRKANPIRGVINMAMLLADAPLVDMTGWQWDRALRLKVDSSWILHEETFNDPLEFFIMYSSIASVLGNRNQAGYNVGNTFLNALASYRHSLGLPGISIALGAMSKHLP